MSGGLGPPIYSSVYLQVSRVLQCYHYTEVLSMKGSSAISNEVAIDVVWGPSGTTESFTLPPSAPPESQSQQNSMMTYFLGRLPASGAFQ